MSKWIQLTIPPKVMHYEGMDGWNYYYLDKNVIRDYMIDWIEVVW